MAQYSEGDWITVNGRHILIGEGESKQDAINRAIAQKNEDTKERQIKNAKEQADKLNAEKNAETKSEFLNKSDEKKFINMLEKAKADCDENKRWRVDIHTAEEYKEKGAKLFTSKGGSTVAVTKDGDIISVCKGSKESEHGAASKLLEKAVKEGGTKLDSYSGNHEFYTKNGFEPVSWTPFSVKYAPDGWKLGRDSKEPVVFYKYVGVGNVKYTGKSGLHKFLSDTKPHTGDSGYDNAQAERDSKIKGGKK